jgi:hypothetical protein
MPWGIIASATFWLAVIAAAIWATVDTLAYDRRDR